MSKPAPAKKTTTANPPAAGKPQKPVPPEKPWVNHYVKRPLITEPSAFKAVVDEKLEKEERLVLENDALFEELEELAAKVREEAAKELVDYAKKPLSGKREEMKDKVNPFEEDALNNAYDAYKLSRHHFRRWRLRMIALMNSDKHRNLILANPKCTKLISWDSEATVLNESSWQEGRVIPRKDIIFQTELGSGAFGVVSKAVVYGNLLAVKVLKTKPTVGNSVTDSIQSTQATASLRASFEAECQVLSQLKDDYILRFMGACFEEEKDKEPFYALITELAENGSLNDILYPRADNPIIISFERKMRITEQIIQGMKYLHGRSPAILHLDLKPANILLDSDYNVRIADFGLSKIMSSSALISTFAGGTPFYMAPEVMPGATSFACPVSTKSDVYSFAIMINELVTQRPPYDGHPDLTNNKTFDQLVKVVHGGNVPGTNRPDVAEGNPDLHDLITACWEADPASRPDFDTIHHKSLHKKAAQTYASGGDAKCGEIAKMFEANQKVEFQEWTKKLSKKFAGPDFESTKSSQFKALMALVDVGNMGEHITSTQSAKFLNWVRDVSPRDNEICNLVYQICSEAWFFGTFPEIEAVVELSADKEAGRYMVRWDPQLERWMISYNVKGTGDQKKVISVKHDVLEDADKTSLTLKRVIKTVQDKIKILEKENGYSFTPCKLRPQKYVNIKGKKTFVEGNSAYTTVNINADKSQAPANTNYIFIV